MNTPTESDQDELSSDVFHEEYGRWLSRSPQPYHRRRESLSLVDGPEILIESSNHVTTESTESGTEADDEKGALLKSLPAPNSRFHKGLRGSTPTRSSTPVRTPLPTPPAIIEQELTGFFESIHADHVEHDPSEDRRRTDRYIQRKAKEIVRRSVEVILLTSVTVLTWLSAPPHLIRPWSLELAATFSISLLSYIAYPVRKSVANYGTASSVLKAGWLGFHIPSRFDLGPLVYPLVLPIIIAMSVIQDRSAYLPVNIACALSSIPDRVTSVWHQDSLVWHIRWLVTMLAVQVPPVPGLESSRIPFGIKIAEEELSLEDCALFFPLHQALKSVLHSFTTTSLDSAELELLTTALINLLLFARSPQAHILKAALWVGGLSILISCRRLMARELALARVPKWKFAKVPEPQSISGRLRRAFKAFMSSTKEHAESSDDEVDERTSLRPLSRVKTIGSTAFAPTDDFSAAAGPVLDGTVIHSTSLSYRRRRSTFSATENKAERRPPSPFRARRVRTNRSSSLLRLTAQQALIRRWAYAGAIYCVVIAILFGPVWYYVYIRALSAFEPLGWALGYAFGNVPAVRQLVRDTGLAAWIKLPHMMEQQQVDIRDLMAYPGNLRLAICAYCIFVLAIGILAALSLTAYVEVDTRRKVFHGVMVAMLLPTIFVDPCFLALALSIILAAFLLLDLFRACQLPPISRPLTNFLAPYTDGRDHRGPVIVSHIFLLIGCAIPLWLSLVGLPRTGDAPWSGWDVPARDLSMISGVVCVGMGDAAASLIGRRYGKTKWYWAGGKSLEGSLAFALAVTVGLMFAHMWLRIGGWVDRDDFDPSSAMLKCIIAGSGASLLESVLTAANDNVVVPIGLWLLVRGLKI